MGNRRVGDKRRAMFVRGRLPRFAGKPEQNETGGKGWVDEARVRTVAELSQKASGDGPCPKVVGRRRFVINFFCMSPRERYVVFFSHCFSPATQVCVLDGPDFAIDENRAEGSFTPRCPSPAGVRDA